ncbi:MAG: 30S ribosomal protein S6 [Gemmatimonadota bacterium]|nr:MAG: 30S ribosomal protein S6 [Gemmatimonadota bacterium]
MTRQYELVYIFDSTLEEAQVNERLERFHTLTKTPEAAEPVTSASHWGKRTLAYPIKGKETGYYVVEQFETNPELLGELERALKLDDAVLRYLLVVNEGLAPVGAERGAEAPTPPEAKAGEEVES